MSKKRTKAFYDFEFTGLHQFTTPISLGIVTSSGEEFYAEFNDYDGYQIDDWLQDNVIDNLFLTDQEEINQEIGSVTFVKGSIGQVKTALREWVSQFEYIEFWGDCSSYDGVLLNRVLGGALNLPDSVNYIFFDISTVFRMYGLDPDVDREAFVDKPIEGNKHNALYDSKIIQACYEKLYRNRYAYMNML